MLDADRTALVAGFDNVAWCSAVAARSEARYVIRVVGETPM